MRYREIIRKFKYISTRGSCWRRQNFGSDLGRHHACLSARGLSRDQQRQLERYCNLKKRCGWNKFKVFAIAVVQIDTKLCCAHFSVDDTPAVPPVVDRYCRRIPLQSRVHGVRQRDSNTTPFESPHPFVTPVGTPSVADRRAFPLADYGTGVN